MASRANLEKIAERLEQSDAILAFLGQTDARLAAVRVLLGDFRSDDMPTSATRDLWMQVAETMLRLGIGDATPDEFDGFSRLVRLLRRAISHHLVSSY